MITRHEILAALGALPAARVPSSGKLYAEATAQLPKRIFGRTGRQVVPLVLGGIGHIDRERPEADQLVANLAAGVSDMPSPEERQGKDTNFYQDRIPAMVQPSEVQTRKDGNRVEVPWNTAHASAEPIRSYGVRAGERLLLSLPYRPQVPEEPFKATVVASQPSEGKTSRCGNR